MLFFTPFVFQRVIPRLSEGQAVCVSESDVSFYRSEKILGKRKGEAEKKR
jgi:hypothetical protein